MWLNKPKSKAQTTNAIGTPIDAKSTIYTKEEHENAPKKEHQEPRVKRRKLFTPSRDEIVIQEMQELVPTIINRLKKDGLKEDFCVLLRTLASGAFPLHNIAFLLLLDVARWYSLDSTTQMKYPVHTMKFWRVLYRMFHGKILRFMSGEKSVGQIIDGTTSKGNYNPQKSSINFAVPSVSCINEFETASINIPREIPPGVIDSAVDFLPRNKSYILSVDGKKLAPGLTDKYGDQDLFQHEDDESQSLQSLQKRIDGEITDIEAIKTSWQNYSDQEKVSKLKEVILMVTNRLKDLRVLFQNQKISLNNFSKKAGEDWRKSKYVFAISSIQTRIYQIKSVVKRLLDVNDALLQEGSSLQDSTQAFTSNDSLDIYSQVNLITLKDPDDVPTSLKDNTKFIKQKTDPWFDRRKAFKVTGSTLYDGIGLDTLKKQQIHYDKVIKGIEPVESEEATKWKQHGTTSEVHARATLAGKVLPFYYPQYQCIEEGFREMNYEELPLILVSPDGGLGTWKIEDSPIGISEPEVACEFKCPVGATIYKTPVHYEIPER